MVTLTTDRMDFDNVTDAHLRWLYNAIVSLANCNPMNFMFHNWFNKRSKTTGKLAFMSFLQTMALGVMTGEGPGARPDM